LYGIQSFWWCLSLDDIIDKEKLQQKDILEYGMALMTNGEEIEVIYKILTKIINREKDMTMRIFKYLQRSMLLEIYFSNYKINSFSFSEDSIITITSSNQSLAVPGIVEVKDFSEETKKAIEKMAEESAEYMIL
jgi:uncharacterized paraquat-inducible protein A